MRFVMTFEGYDWDSGADQGGGMTYDNVVDDKHGSVVQKVVIPPIEKIDVSEDSIRIDQQRLYDEVAILCGQRKEVLKPGSYYSRDTVLHFANADDLRSGNMGNEWKGGFLVLYKVGRNPRWKKGVSALDGSPSENQPLGDPSVRYKKGYMQQPSKRNSLDATPEEAERAFQMRLKPHLRNL